MFGLLCPAVGIWIDVGECATPDPDGWASAIGYISMATIVVLRIPESRDTSQPIR
jgi:hypothetical protein